MSAPDLSGISGNYFPAVQKGFADSLNGSITAGSTSMVLHSVSGYSDGDAVFLWIDPSGTSAELVWGLVNVGTLSVTSLVRGVIGSAAAHSSGATVAQYVSSADHMSMRKGILVEHHENGTHGDVTADSLSVSNTLSLPNGSVTNAMLAGSLTAGKLGTDSSWAWTSWTPTLTGITKGNGVLTAEYIQVGKTISFRFQFVLGSTSAVTGAIKFSPPATAAFSGPDQAHGIQAMFLHTGILNVAAWGWFQTVSLITLRHLAVSGSNVVVVSDTSSTAPFTWGNGDVITAAGTYEAA